MKYFSIYLKSNYEGNKVLFRANLIVDEDYKRCLKIYNEIDYIFEKHPQLKEYNWIT